MTCCNNFALNKVYLFCTSRKCNRYPKFPRKTKMEVSTWAIITLIISIIGLLGNIALMVTYRKKNLQIRFNVLMITLACFDIFYLISDSITQFQDFWLLMHLRGFGFSASILTTVCISFERYMVLCKNSELVDKVPIGVNIFLIIFFSVLINSTKV